MRGPIIIKKSSRKFSHMVRAIKSYMDHDIPNQCKPTKIESFLSSNVQTGHHEGFSNGVF